MDAQFKFFGNPAIGEANKPVMAGLNSFLTDRARGGETDKLLGEKKDVKVWLAWLERKANKEVSSIETPIGNLPLFDDLKDLFKSIIDKTYSIDLYTRHFSLYIDNIVSRIDLQLEAYSKELRIPERLFYVLKQQRKALLLLRETYGPVVSPDQLLEVQ